MELPNSERWDEINTLLLEAEARPAEERAAFLEEASGGDESLRRQVASLLDAASTYGALLENGAAALARPLLAPEGEALPEEASTPVETGQRVGPYRLLERIGEGGTSTVYRAERADGQFERVVAIKVLRQALGLEAEATERFRAEQQILASLSHPHLAEVYDGGVLSGGQPYLVMEYVDGRPLTEHCRAEDCSLDERLSLFRQAAEAVQAAHEQLVVHRDIKPSNVLVERDTGQVKLLDFGIAKMLGELPGEAAPTTQTGRQPMTPAYAAPEQVKGEAISVATDVYALGVLLYELLTDERPYGREDRSPYAVARAVCEEEPSPPSEVVDEWRSALQGDLDAIVSRAIRKEPLARYDTVDDLTDDLERHLSDRPVLAQRGNWTYRARKFVRRNRGLLAGVALALTLLAGFAAYHVQRLSAERDRAHAQAQKAEQVSEFLVGLFEASNPTGETAETVTAQDLLRKGRKRIAGLEGQPAARAQMLDAMGRAYLGLGRYSVADSMLREALAVRRRLYEANTPPMAAGFDHLAEAAEEQGRYAVAESLGHNALSIRRTRRDSLHPNVANSLGDLARYKQQRGQYAAAESLYREALSRKKTIYERPSRPLASTTSELAQLLTERGEYAVAGSLSRETLSMRRALFGNVHPKTSESLARLARTVEERGHFAEAGSLYQQTLAIDRAVLGAKHPTVATDLNDLAIVLEKQKRLAEAESLQRKSLRLSEQRLSDDHPDITATLHNLAVVLRKRGKYNEAASLYERVLRRVRRKYEAAHPHVAYTLGSLADVRRDQGRYARADSLYRESLTMLKTVFDEEDPRVATGMGKIGNLHKVQGQYREAEKWHRKALTLRRNALGKDAPATGESLVNVADVLVKQEKPEAAESVYREALATYKRALPEGDWRRASVRGKLGMSLVEQGAYVEAEPLLRSSYERLRAQRGSTDTYTWTAARHLVRLYEAWNKPKKAEKYREGFNGG